LIFPYFSDAVGKGDEKKIVTDVVNATAALKQQCISFMKVGEIATAGTDLVFYLDNVESQRIHLPQLIDFSNVIYFNRTGITRGGEIVLKFSRRYRIVIQPVSGRISVE